MALKVDLPLVCMSLFALFMFLVALLQCLPERGHLSCIRFEYANSSVDIYYGPSQCHGVHVPLPHVIDQAIGKSDVSFKTLDAAFPVRRDTHDKDIKDLYRHIETLEKELKEKTAKLDAKLNAFGFGHTVDSITMYVSFYRVAAFFSFFAWISVVVFAMSELALDEKGRPYSKHKRDLFEKKQAEKQQSPLDMPVGTAAVLSPI